MSKQTHTGACEKANETFYATSGQQGRDMKRKLWAEHMKRKEAAKKKKVSPMDKFYNDVSYKTAKGITAFYLAASGKNINRKTFKENYKINTSTYDRYIAWFAKGEFTGKPDRIASHVIELRNELLAAIKKAPAPTVKEITRLYAICNPEYFNIQMGRVYKPNRSKKNHVEDYDHMLNSEQKADLQDLANLELAEVKTVSKSDVIAGVITGAMVGAAFATYIFLTNGAI